MPNFFSLKAWEIPLEASTVAPESKWQWSNRDMDPVPPEERVWTWFSYVSEFGAETLRARRLHRRAFADVLFLLAMWISDSFS